MSSAAVELTCLDHNVEMHGNEQLTPLKAAAFTTARQRDIHNTVEVALETRENIFMVRSESKSQGYYDQ